MKYIRMLQGEHIYLSPMCVEDAEKYVLWMNDYRYGYRNLQRGEWIKRNITNYQFAIIQESNNELIGNCGINALNQIHQCSEIGIFIGEEEKRNKGYGTEALQLLLQYGFQYLNLHNIMLKVFSFNQRAIQCYKKVGFQEIGRRREAYFLKGTYYDEIFMDILRKDWEKIVQSF